MAGWFAVNVWWNPDGFPEPWDTGDGRYALQADAIQEAKEWSEAYGLPFVAPQIDDWPARQDVEQQIREIIPGVQVIHVCKE